MSTGQDWKGQVRTSQVKKGHVGTGQVETGEVGTGRVINRLVPEELGQARTYVRAGQVWSDQFRLGEVRTDQARKVI